MLIATLFPVVAAKVRFPVTARIVLSSASVVPVAIPISPTQASLNGLVEEPRYAPSSASGMIPVFT